MKPEKWQPGSPADRVLSLRLQFFGIIVAAILSLDAGRACAQSSAFSYQGQLNNNGGPARGVFELQFTLFDASTNGTRIAGPVTNAATVVTNGVFSVKIDFGPKAFNGGARWLEIGVRTNASTNQFFILKPRQPLAHSREPCEPFDEALNLAPFSLPSLEKMKAAREPLVVMRTVPRPRRNGLQTET